MFKWNFIATPLLHNVDLVLGIEWLKKWNPIIDWASEIVVLRVDQPWITVKGNHMPIDV